ncbi:MAG: DUF3703 domain-containing protein [Pseudomonadales bacterium]
MNPALRRAYQAELTAAGAATVDGNVEVAFHHLERAHILAQRLTSRHVYVHWRMLRLGASTRAWREVAGQSVRIVAAALFSRVWVPIGNTGRAHVGAMQPMPLPDDLRGLLENDRA